MGRASADPSTSGHGTPVRRRRHFFRHRSPTPSSIDETSQELSPSYAAASFLEQPSVLPVPYGYDDGDGMGSYVAVAPLPVFRGDPGECPDAHIARFDRVRRANGAATPAAAARIFPASLDGDAALWVSGADDDSLTPPWDAVRAAFLDFFRPPGAADRARAELAALSQGPGEAINRYHLRLQGVLRRCSGVGVDVSDALSKAAFVDGLLAEFRDCVAPQHPKALDDAVALALIWERAEGVREAWRVAKAACAPAPAPATPAVVRCSFCGADGHEEALCEAWMSGGGGGRGGAVVVAKEEGGASEPLVRLGSAVSTRSCQCRRHQCGKKAVAPSEVAGDGDASAVAAEKSFNQLAGLEDLLAL
ncbi:hypothetical protein SORBI_3003G023100 [Sorghum bicolor]|uniref:Retrotransposon gag domain-containing protein n=1 Tax=Sorghum bicolor TaxID=4558 RepID=C5XL50_SORBI|nr:hypothetical protein SORBI_3003G023100 [Sorghum bicolor]